MCLPLCKTCKSIINRPLPVYCSRKCKGKDVRELFKTRQFIWELATEEEKGKRIRAHFENNVIKGPDCWDWKFKQKKFTYPRMQFNKKVPRIAIHRYSYELYKGPIPEGMWVLHKCDNPRCSNPEHLFLGSSDDNINDMIGKKRHPHGEKHGCAKLTEEKVKEIKSQLSSSSLMALAKKYNVAKKTIVNIKHNRTWKWVKI